jgi:hypothetical protein
MKKVKEDIFPDLQGAEGLQDILQGLANRVFEAFSAMFSSKDDVIQYINDFKEPKIAKLFLDIADYYYHAKFYYCPKCFPPTRLDKCPSCENPFEMPAHIVLVMVISLMEKLSRGLSEYIDFYNWISPQKINSIYHSMVQSGKLQSGEIENVGKLISSLKDEWRVNFGSSTKITDFFKGFLTKEEKIEFVKSVKFEIEVPELPPRGEGFDKISYKLKYEEWMQEYEKEIQKHNLDSVENIKKYVADNNFKMTKEALPICFDKIDYWNCFQWDPSGTGVGFCHHKYKCKLKSNEEFLDECFKKIVQVIYNWRNQFVHEAQIPPITEIAICGGIYRKKKSSEKRIVVLLTTQELKPVFERMVKKYFNQYQKDGKEH